MGIVVFGSVFVDIKGYPFAQYIDDGRNAGHVIQVHGGVSRNVAEDIANVELCPTFVSVVDDSGTSQDVVAKLRRHRVNVDYILTRPGGLGTWLAVFNNNGDLVASISQRPDLSAIGELLVEKGDEIIRNADSVVVEIDMEADLLTHIFRLAERYHKAVYAVVSNMTIAMERRDLLSRTACVVCNQEEAGILFSDNYQGKTPEEMQQILEEKILQTRIPKMVVTLGGSGAVYAEKTGNPRTAPDAPTLRGSNSVPDGAPHSDNVQSSDSTQSSGGYMPALGVVVRDTAGCGDSFFAGVAIGLTYGKSLREACSIGTRLAASVIATTENVCPRFRPEEFGLKERPQA